MTPRAAAVQGGLAVVGLSLAYTTWQREPERAPGEVVVLQATHSEIERVHYEDGTHTTDLERGGPAEPAVWIKQGASADGNTPARALRGSEAAEKLLDQFGPLHAARALGTLDASKLKELGFEGSKKKMEVTARGAKRAFTLVGPTYGTFYLQDDQNGHVYLVTGPPVAEVESAARLVDRRLHEFQPSEFDGVTIIVGAKRRELVQPSPTAPNPAGIRLASRANAAKIDELASNWHDKLWRVTALEVLGKGETPKHGAPEIALRIEYSLRGKQKGWLEIGRGPSSAPEAALSTTEKKPNSSPGFFARSEHTVGWVGLPATADDVLKEATKVVAAP